MAERYTSLIGLQLRRAVDVAEVVASARAVKDIDRAAAVGDPSASQEVHWGGRMQKAVVRQLVDEMPLLRTEAYIGADGLEHGLQRQVRLLQVLVRQLRSNVVGVRDLSAMVDRDEAWLHRIAGTSATYEDAVVVRSEGQGTWWTRTHGAARFDVPDLELYGLKRGQVPAAEAALAHVHRQLLDQGLKGSFALPDGTPVYLVPVLEAWQHVPFEWTGVGRAGRDRGPGLDGPRATLSVLRPSRLGRYKRDFEGVLRSLAS